MLTRALMTKLLFVAHCPSPNTRVIRDAALNALSQMDGVAVRSRDSLQAGATDVQWCDALALGTTENFGAMAGRTKDFFERIYYPLMDQRPALPVVCYVRAGEDGVGTVQGIERIVTGLKWRWAQPPLVLQGAYQDDFAVRAATLLETLAAGTSAGIF